MVLEAEGEDERVELPALWNGAPGGAAREEGRQRAQKEGHVRGAEAEVGEGSEGLGQVADGGGGLDEGHNGAQLRAACSRR